MQIKLTALLYKLFVRAHNPKAKQQGFGNNLHTDACQWNGGRYLSSNERQHCTCKKYGAN